MGETFPKHTFLMNGLVQGVKVQIKVTIKFTVFLTNLQQVPVHVTALNQSLIRRY